MPVPDLVSRAARFFVLAEQSHGWGLRYPFWELSAPVAVETVSHLPAMATAVREPVDPLAPPVLLSVASHPLPTVLPPEAVPWYTRLVAAWEGHRASGPASMQNLARLALVRLDGCGMPDGQERRSRLSEWLAEAQKIASGEWEVVNGEWRVIGVGSEPSRTGKGRMTYGELEALAALAAWRPAARVITRPETLRAWVDFWLEVRRSDDPMKKGIAAIAMLNLPEADLRAASIPPVPAMELLHQLSGAIQVAAIREDRNYLSLLDWQPIEGTTLPVEGVRNVARTLLKVAIHNQRYHRCTAWQQIIRWDRASCLTTCGVDLLPALVKAVPTEESEFVLWELAQWVPSAERFTATGTSVSLLRKLESVWERHRTSRDALVRASAWLAGIRLHQAGLASESPERFLNAYLSAVADERNPGVLLILARWSPGADAPEKGYQKWHDGWQQRLLDKEEVIRPIAAWTLLPPPPEKTHCMARRWTMLEPWRAGIKVSPETSHILDAVLLQLQRVRASLAAGEVPDFEGKMFLPAERCRLPLALPPGRIADNEWKMENEKLKMENGEWGVKHQKATPQPNPRLGPDSPSRSGMSES